MKSSINNEVHEHLKNKDYSLTVRRMLDLSYDSADPGIFREAT